MAKTVTIDRLAAEITQAVKDYTDSVSQAISKEVETTAIAVQTDIKATAPKRTGEYQKGWARRKETGSGSITYRIYNKDKPQLTHLLEHGHVKRGGGRVSGKPHIGPAFDSHKPALERRIEQIIKNGG